MMIFICSKSGLLASTLEILTYSWYMQLINMICLYDFLKAIHLEDLPDIQNNQFANNVKILKFTIIKQIGLR